MAAMRQGTLDIAAEPGVLTRFLYANWCPPTDQVRGHASLENALGRRGVTERVADLIDDLLDQDAVVALAHHPDHRLGAGGADQQAAVAVEAPFAVDDRRLHPGMVERLAA